MTEATVFTGVSRPAYEAAMAVAMTLDDLSLQNELERTANTMEEMGRLALQPGEHAVNYAKILPPADRAAEFAALKNEGERHAFRVALVNETHGRLAALQDAWNGREDHLAAFELMQQEGIAAFMNQREQPRRILEHTSAMSSPDTIYDAVAQHVGSRGLAAVSYTHLTLPTNREV